MPLTLPTQLSDLETYKKLLRADAQKLTAKPTKFRFCPAFNFGKVTAPALFFGEIPTTLATTVKSSGPNAIKGLASLNETEEIVLTPESGVIALGKLASTLASHGVTRKLAVPKGEEEKPTTTENINQTIESPQRNRSEMPKTGIPTLQKNTGIPPLQKNAPPTPTFRSPVSPLNIKPNPEIKPPSPREEIQENSPRDGRSRLGPKEFAPKPNFEIEKPKPKSENEPLKRKDLFNLRLKKVNVRYMELTNGNAPQEFKTLREEMLKKANVKDWDGAFSDLRKLDSALGEIAVKGQREAKQTRRSEKLEQTFGAVRKNYFKPGYAEHLKEMGGGGEFKNFIGALEHVEKVRDEMAFENLEIQANGYLQHLANDFNDNKQQDESKKQKKEICLTALKNVRHYRLALEHEKLGPPPWDHEKEMVAGELYSKLLFEQEDDKLATPNSHGGAAGSWWLEKTAWDDTVNASPEKKKTFIFKPLDEDAIVPGFPLGGGPSREVLGKAISDQLGSAMGLDFGVPETSIIKVDNSKLPNSDKQINLDKPSQRVGSIQHFAKSEGPLQDKLRDSEFLKKFQPEDVHKQAILDLVSLNMDRHSGNYMVGEKEGPNNTKIPTLVPIDNGLCVPSREGLNTRRMKLGVSHNALSNIPCIETKMSQEMVDKIQQIDPEKVIKGMKEAFESMAKLHPEVAKSSEITEENFKLTKRSILFLKKASSELTVAEIQDAYVQGVERIFDSSEEEMELKFNEAIEIAKNRSAARQELERLTADGREYEKFMKSVSALGWGYDLGTKKLSWIRQNPELLLKAYKNQTPSPIALRRIEQMLEQLKDLPSSQTTEKIKGQPPASQIVELERLLSDKRLVKAEKEGLVSPTGEKRLEVESFHEFGGNEAVAKLKSGAENLSYEERANLLGESKFKALGGQDKLDKLLKSVYRTPVATPMQKAIALREYDEYLSLGGDEVYFRLGGDVENSLINGRLRVLREMLVTNEVKI